MNLINKLAKRFGYVKQQKRGSDGFAAAVQNRLTADFADYSKTIDSILRIDLPVLRARSRELSRSNPYVLKFFNMLKANVLGAGGLMLKNKAKEPDKIKDGRVIVGRPDVFANRVIEQGWRDWGRRENCTVDKRLSWREVEGLVLDTVAMDGEALVRMHFGRQFNAYGFALQVIDPERLDVKHNEKLANGNIIKMGVEMTQAGERVAYHILHDSPHDYEYAYAHGIHAKQRVRIPANEFLHPFMVRYIGQNRGHPWMSPIMLDLKMLGGYQESMLVGSRAAASKMGFLKTTGDQRYTGPSDGTGPLMEAEPGSFEMLPQGIEVQSIDWGYPNANFQDFCKAILRSIAAGLNVSYNTLANDLEGVNFSSGRMGQLEEREHWKLLQGWFSGVLHQPVFSAWLASALLNGQLAGLPSGKINKFDAATWRGRRWTWVDPQKEVNAKIMELNAGLTSLSRVLGELNIDRDELFAEIKDDQETLKNEGISLSEVWQSTASTGGMEQQPDDDEQED